jgi:hypothetical protein
MDQENALFIHNEILLIHKEEWNVPKLMDGDIENIILSEIRLRRPKITCSPSYAD